MSNQSHPSKSSYRQRLRPSRPRSTIGRAGHAAVRPTLGTLLRTALRNGKLAALGCVLGGLWAIWFLFSSERFTIQTFDVSGNRSLSTAEIIELAGVKGQSIWEIDPQFVAAQLATNTYVVTAPTTVLLPDQVLIRVQEREAVIFWHVAGINYEVAATGEVLGPARSTADNALVVFDTRTTPITTGMHIDSDALELVQILHLRIPEELGWTPTRYEWDPYYGISLYNDQRQIAFGRLADQRMPLDAKLAVIDQLNQNSEWVFLDVRSTKPYYRGQSTPTPEP